MSKRGPYGRRGGKSMLEGMTTKSPEASDASTQPKGGSVDSNATRGETSATPKTLGPRVA